MLVLALTPTVLCAQPAITNQPASQTVREGGNALFSVGVSGTDPVTYQWQFNGTNLPASLITTVAGNGTSGYSGDGGLAYASLDNPTGMAVDTNGNLYIADRQNDRIRKVDTYGIISTMAGIGTGGGNGLGSFSGDGGNATNAGLRGPHDLAFDNNGNLFITDQNDNRVRRVDTNGIITTVAGGGTSGLLGDNGYATNATLGAPAGIAVDSSGDLLIADLENNRVRKVDVNGTITTFAGGGTNNPDDGGLATNAVLYNIDGVAVDASGDVFVADTYADRVCKVDTNRPLNKGRFLRLEHSDGSILSIPA